MNPESNPISIDDFLEKLKTRGQRRRQYKLDPLIKEVDSILKAGHGALDVHEFALESGLAISKSTAYKYVAKRKQVTSPKKGSPK
ncbi:MAG: hypothetical protein Q7K26_06175 [bacterium]|nr:hypothetical protein [bacterium]